MRHLSIRRTTKKGQLKQKPESGNITSLPESFVEAEILIKIPIMHLFPQGELLVSEVGSKCFHVVGKSCGGKALYKHTHL